MIQRQRHMKPSWRFFFKADSLIYFSCFVPGFVISHQLFWVMNKCIVVSDFRKIGFWYFFVLKLFTLIVSKSRKKVGKIDVYFVPFTMTKWNKIIKSFKTIINMIFCCRVVLTPLLGFSVSQIPSCVGKI